jgi:acyl-CoA reductase-like NAD-dependent aldehyde dehydrogenase
VDSRTMNEEPFGPVAIIAPFATFDDVVARPIACLAGSRAMPRVKTQ